MTGTRNDGAPGVPVAMAERAYTDQVRARCGHGAEGGNHMPEWIIVAVIAVVVLFGAKKLPEMARSVGRAQGEFKKGLKEGTEPEAASGTSSDTSPQAQTKAETQD